MAFEQRISRLHTVNVGRRLLKDTMDFSTFEPVPALRYGTKLRASVFLGAGLSYPLAIYIASRISAQRHLAVSVNYEETIFSEQGAGQIFFISLHADRKGMWSQIETASKGVKTVSVITLNPTPEAFATDIINSCGIRYFCPPWQQLDKYESDTGFIPTAGTLSLFLYLSMLLLNEDCRTDLSGWISQAASNLYANQLLRRDVHASDTHWFFLGPKESAFALADIKRRFLELGRPSVLCVTYSDFLHGLYNCIDPKTKNAFYFLDDPHLHIAGKEIHRQLADSGFPLYGFQSTQLDRSNLSAKWIVESVVLSLMLAECENNNKPVDEEWVRISSLILN